MKPFYYNPAKYKTYLEQLGITYQTLKNRKLINMKKYCFLLLSLIAVNAHGQNREIDSLVERTLKAFDVPGIAVAVIKDGKVIHSKGYGVRSLNTSSLLTRILYLALLPTARRSRQPRWACLSMKEN